MANINLPLHQYDDEAAEELNKYSSVELQPYIPELIKYLIDVNWPVRKPIKKLLNQKFSGELVAPFNDIFLGDDNEWKVGCLTAIINYRKSTLDALFPWIDRFATSADFYEVDDGLQKHAANILFERFPEKYTRYNKQQFIDFLIQNQLLKQEQVQSFDFAKYIDIKKYKNAFKVIVCNRYDSRILTIAYIISGHFWMADLTTIDLLPHLTYQDIIFNKGTYYVAPLYEAGEIYGWFQYEIKDSPNWYDSLSQINLIEIIESIAQAHQKVIDKRGIQIE